MRVQHDGRRGGIAAALSDDDSRPSTSPTMVAGAGLCDPDAVRVLAYEDRLFAVSSVGALRSTSTMLERYR